MTLGGFSVGGCYGVVWWDSTGRGSGCQAGPVCTCLAGKPQSYHGSPCPTDPVDPFCGRGGRGGAGVAPPGQGSPLRQGEFLHAGAVQPARQGEEATILLSLLAWG